MGPKMADGGASEFVDEGKSTPESDPDLA